MGLIAHKVNDVLVKLDQFEDVTREMSAKMRQLNAQIDKLKFLILMKKIYVILLTNKYLKYNHIHNIHIQY